MSDDPKDPSRANGDGGKAAVPSAAAAASDAPQQQPASPPELIPPLSERRRRFVLEYVIDLNGAAAARRAGYAPGKAGARASELLRRADVRLAIRAEMKERDQRLRLTAERIVGEAMCIAFADPTRIAHWSKDGVELVDSHDLTPDDRRAVKWISVGGRKGEHAQRFEMHDKLRALEFLARMTGLLTRAPGRGRFALLQEDEEREKRDANAILRERLMRIVNSKRQE